MSKTNITYSLIFTVVSLISIFLNSCKFSYKMQPKEITNLEDSTSLLVAKKSLQFIQKNDVDGLKKLFNIDVIQKVQPEQLSWLFREGQKVLLEYQYPSDTHIINSHSKNISMVGKQVTNIFSFPFRNKVYNDSLKYFHITVVDNEIHGLFLNDHPPGIRIIESR